MSNQTQNQTQARIPIQNPIFEEMEKAKSAASTFVKIQPGESIVFDVDVNSIQIVDRQFEGKTSKAGQYKVKMIGSDEEKTLTLSLSWATALNALLKKGFTTIEMTRKGAGRDTEYTFVPF